MFEPGKSFTLALVGPYVPFYEPGSGDNVPSGLHVVAVPNRPE